MNAKKWRKARKRQFDRIYDHVQGYCGDQMCCWGQPGDRVQWAKRRKA